MPVVGNVNDVSAADYSPPSTPITAPAQGGSGNWFADNAPDKSTQNVSIKTPEKQQNKIGDVITDTDGSTWRVDAIKANGEPSEQTKIGNSSPRHAVTSKSTSQTTSAAPHTISATKPSFLERVTAPFVGEGTTYGTLQAQRSGAKWAAGQDPFIKPLIDLNAIKAEDITSNPVARGVIRGVEQTATDFTPPHSAEIMAATAGLGAEFPAASKLLAGGFGFMQIKGALQRSPEFKEKLKSGDTEGAVKVLTEIGLGLEMGRRALNHAGSTSETISRPKDSRAPTRPYSPDLSKGRRVAEPDSAPVEKPANKPAAPSQRPNPPSLRKTAPKASVPVEGLSDAEQRTDFERAQANLADLKKNGPRRKTPPWENRPLANRAKIIAQQAEAASKAKAASAPETPAAEPVEQAPATGQSQLPLGKAQPIESLPEPKAAKKAAAPQKPVGSLGLQEAVENPAGVESKKSVAEPVAKPAEKVAPDGKVASDESRPAEGKGVWQLSDPTPPEHSPVRMNTSDITADPQRFQFKGEAIGKGGTTDEFRNVKKWDESSAGILQVWRDPADEKVYVVNGHHRLEMANRTATPDVKVMFLDAPDATTARIRGALTNIRDGKGTSIDAAKIFRDMGLAPQDMESEGISPDSRVSKEGLALSGLSDRAFTKVVDGDLLTSHGAVIGEKLRGKPETQDSLIAWLKKQKVRYNANEIGDIVDQWERFDQNGPAPTKEDSAQGRMFDDDVAQTHYFGEKAKIQEEIRSKLKGDKKLFGLLSKQSAASKLESQAGNVIDVEGNRDVATVAAQLSEIYDKLVNRAGEMEDIVTDAAQKVANGMSKENAASEAYPKIREAIQRVIGPGKDAR